MIENEAAHQLTAIWAQSTNQVIGRAGKLPWHLPAELQHFARTTAHSTVIMGRRTWQSLPSAGLVNRRCIVLSRTIKDVPGWFSPSNQLQLADSTQAALDLLGQQSGWIIGGAQAFRALWPWVQRAIVTVIEATVTGDTLAPSLAGFQCLNSQVRQSAGFLDGQWHQLSYQVQTWQRAQ
jgi:dihydrofolate reductase